MKSFLKKYIWDILIIATVLLGSVIALICINIGNKNTNLIARIECQSVVIDTIDLSKENEERTFTIQGKVNEVTIGVKHNAIAILNADCITHFCEHEGYINKPGKPIICAYNEVIITIIGKGDTDIIL